jgi:hypothetical protein
MRQKIIREQNRVKSTLKSGDPAETGRASGVNAL